MFSTLLAQADTMGTPNAGVAAVSLTQKLATLWPEMALMIGAVVCLLFGLSKSVELRRLCSWVAFASVVLAALLVPATAGLTADAPDALGVAREMASMKLVIAVAGVLLLLVNAYVPSQIRQVRLAEASDDFEPADTIRGEFYFFLLFSLAGAMLCTAASSLPWLFLALELVSLPTYVMVATSRERIIAQESAVKYFFLGAMSAAVFLYGFALIYGATGFTDFASIRGYVAGELAAGRELPDLLLVGLLLSVLGVAFKVAAFPMHFYAADVYQGATTAVTAFLAVVPKAAGFVALILVLSLVGWPLPAPVAVVIAGMAVATMCVGNILGLVQGTSVKRVLAYSSVAHSGYLLVGLLAGQAGGIGAVVFYLAAYATATIAAFAVLAMLEVQDDDGPREADTFQDLSGLAREHPVLSAVLLISMVSLIGIPPLVGFFGKLVLFVPAFEAGYAVVVVVAVINSAVSAAYYLRIAATPYAGHPDREVTELPAAGRRTAAVIAAVLAALMGLFAAPVLRGLQGSGAGPDDVPAAAAEAEVAATDDALTSPRG